MDGIVPKDRAHSPSRDSAKFAPRVETSPPAVADERAQELGDLYFAAENFPVALEYYRRALDFEAGRADSAKREVMLRVGFRIVECLRHRGDLTGAVDALHDLHRRLRPQVTREQVGRLSVSLAMVLQDRGEYRAAYRAAGLGYRLLRDTNHHLDLGRAEVVLGLVALRTGDGETAREHFESSIATFRRAGYPAGMMAAYNNLALVHKNQCRFKEASRFLEQGLRIGERAGFFLDSATFLHNLGIVHEKLGELDLAEEHYQRALNVYTEMGYQPGRARSTNCLGIIRRRRRDFTHALTLSREALTIAEERGYARERVVIQEAIGDVYAERGELDLARRAYDTTYALSEQIAPESDLTVQVVRRLGDLELAAGNLDAATRYAERTLDLARRLRDRYEEGCGLRLYGLVRAEAGDLEGAAAALSEAGELLGTLGIRYELARLQIAAGISWRRRARRGKSRGVLDQSVAFLRRAVASFEGLAVPAWTSRALLELARSELLRGLVDEAVIHVDHASSLVSGEEDPAFAREIDDFRGEIERGLIEGTSASSNEFAAFDEVRGVLRRGEADVAVQDVLSVVARRTNATRGFVSAPSAAGPLEVVAALGIAARSAQELLAEVDRRVGTARLAGAPLVTSRAGADERFRDLPASAHIGAKTTIAIVPLPLPSGQPGFLYLDRSEDGPYGAFKQREINLMAVLANNVAMAILELQRQKLANENSALRGRLLGSANSHGIVTRSPELLEILSLLDRVGPTDATILIEGETGSGKGLLARAIHASSNRTVKPLITVNCAALPEHLLESELFGHVQGAFTGAVRDKVGLFVEANGGTIFLDEVDKTSITIQGKLLQVLDTKEVRPVGGNRATKVDVRVLCATNVNLKARIARGEFLEDLYYRLNDICFRVPPLRERPEDVPLLVEHYSRRYAAEMGKDIRGIDPELIGTFAGLPWRGNVRELEKVVKRMVVMANDGDSMALRLAPKELLKVEEEASEGPSSLRAEVAKVERRLISQALERHNWNKLQAAKELSLSYPTLLQKIKIFRLDRRSVTRQRA
ncbi:MAG TPA: sigma 54-interacting transcriptional regulator [Candidatus Eisenbacteria bacterium]|nr:sigma 54-interacting transcriptional regulator [Candidatus Eisenbacteria bacterium]